MALCLDCPVLTGPVTGATLAVFRTAGSGHQEFPVVLVNPGGPDGSSTITNLFIKILPQTRAQFHPTLLNEVLYSSVAKFYCTLIVYKD